jgi:antitoxin component YwqK of YwqJK toxin-antitoxin module
LTIKNLKEKSMSRIWFLAFAVLPLSNCGNVNVVENKNEAGQLVERFAIDPKTKLKEGLHETFFTENGGKCEQSNYKSGILRGEQIFYFENGQVRERRNFDENGSFTGVFKSYYDNGHLKSEGQYDNGAMDGKWKFFYKSGNIKEIIFYKNNVENGPFIEYHENGKIAADGTYLNELETGLLKIYDDKGNLTTQKQCENGACRTTWTSSMSADSAKKM